MLWGFKHLPASGGAPMITHPSVYRQWSKHFTEGLGFVHGPWLAAQADENGYIHVSQIPGQKLRYQEPHRGPRHDFNASGGWVETSTEDPKPIVLPDVNAMTNEEKAAMLAQFRAAGLIPDDTPQRDTAQEFS